MFNLSKFLVRQAHHELVYPELVEGMPYGNSFRISNTKKKAKTLIPRCRFILSLSKEEGEESRFEDVICTIGVP